MVTGSVWLCRESRQQASKCGFMGCASAQRWAIYVASAISCIHVYVRCNSFPPCWSPDDVCLFLLAQTQCSSCHLPKRRRTISTHGDCGGFYLSPQTRIRSVTEYPPHRMYSISWGGVLHDQACRSIIPQLAWYSGLTIFIKMEHFSLVLLPWTEHFPGHASFIGIC